MHPATLGAYALLELALCLIPGPAVLLVVATSLQRGLRDGLVASLAINAGNATYFALSALGVTALLLASQHVFVAVKFAGAAYLAYLGLRALFARAVPAARPLRLVRSFAGGYVTQLANPKALVFFVAVLPQFVDLKTALASQLVALALTTFAIEALVLGAYAFTAEQVRRSGFAQRAALWIERLGGAALLAIAAGIAREPLGAQP